jgi:DNA-binding transcriptional MerR regulator/methylmalonyl-CoA mutase cobalamin-binding subunit
MDEPRYRIGTVAKLTGLSTHVIRVWERRYHSLEPERGTHGARLYSDREVERLKRLKRAVDDGHPIGQVVELDDAALDKLAPALVRPAAPPTAADTTADDAAEGALLVELIDAVQRFDAARAEHLLDHAQASFSARTLVQRVLAPLLRRIGDAWASGKVCAASEHVATVLVRERAGALLRSFPREAGRETLVATTPAGELHEIGALLAAVTAAMQGAGVVYLGPNLPHDDIVLAASAAQADAVALSVVSLEVERATEEIRALASALPASIELLLGGARAATIAERVPRTLTLLPTLADLERWFARRRSSALLRA